MNKVILIGRLTKDPELKTTQSGSPFCNFALAVDRPSKDGDKTADFIQCQVWGTQAENFVKYMAKGRQVAVDGQLRVDRIERNGSSEWFTKVACRQIEYLGGGQKAEPKKLTGTDFGQEVAFSDEDLPF